MKPDRANAPQSCSGSSLIEVLVSLVIMSIATLGMAALQAQSIGQQVSATSRAKLAFLTADFSDRMRSNLSQVPKTEQSANASAFHLVSSWANQALVPVAVPKFCNASDLGAQQRSVCDVASWRVKLREEIPGGSAQISGSSQDGIKLTLMWFDKQHRTRPDLKRETEQLRDSDSCDKLGLSSASLQNCCPGTAQVPKGVRCHTTLLLP